MHKTRTRKSIKCHKQEKDNMRSSIWPSLLWQFESIPQHV